MDEETEKPLPAKPSRVPSWFMLGFVLGAGLILALPRPRPPPAVEQAPERPAPPPAIPQITTIEAVFDQWSQYASWDRDLTEVALWNSDTESYHDCFEVLRFDGDFYFRSIPELTRPVLTHGVKENSPLEFTETEEQRAQWLKDVHDETVRQIQQAISLHK